MPVRQQDVDDVVKSLTETRVTEVKTWFDPTLPDGQSKLIRTLLR